MQERYINDPEFALYLRVTSALAFVPPNDAQNSFDQLAALIRKQYGNFADGILDCFEDNYVGRFRVNAARGITTFPIDIWNMFHRTDDELMMQIMQTNNGVEWLHRRFQAYVSACHHVFRKFLEVIQKEVNVARLGLLQNEGGH